MMGGGIISKAGYIFDMDGVLVASEEYYFSIRMKFLREMNLPIYYSDINDYVGVDPKEEWEMMIPDPQQRTKLLPVFEAFWEKHPIDYRKCLNDQVPEFLADLRKMGKRVALASVGTDAEVNQMLTQCQLSSYIDVVLTGEDVTYSKPAPDIYLQALSSLDLKAGECVVIEDSQVGIKAAKAAKIETWAIQDPRLQIDQSQADQIFDGFGSIRDQLERSS